VREAVALHPVEQAVIVLEFRIDYEHDIEGTELQMVPDLR
jgi:hypothetical protein